MKKHIKRGKKFISLLITSAMVFAAAPLLPENLGGIKAFADLTANTNVPTTAAAVKGLSATSYNVDVGQSKTINVITNEAATHVFATIDGASVKGISQGKDSAGNVTWSLTFTAGRTQVVPIYANTEDSTDGAVVLNVQVTVNVPASVGTGTGAKVGTSGVVINDVKESEATTSGTVVLTVETNTLANDVWVQYDSNKFAKAGLDSETATSKIWSITFKPQNAQAVTVNANTGYFTRDAATQPFNITLSSGSSSGTSAKQGNASISSVRANKSNLAAGENITLTITTNLNTTSVWVDVDNRDVTAKMSRESRATKTWTVTFKPDRSQTVTVYANSGSDSTEGAVNKTHHITVNEQQNKNAKIIEAHVSYSNNNWATIEVETNSSANYVWFELNGSRLATISNYSTLSNGNRKWTYDVYWNEWDNNNNYYNYQTVKVYAGENNNVSNDSRSVNIN